MKAYSHIITSKVHSAFTNYYDTKKEIEKEIEENKDEEYCWQLTK